MITELEKVPLILIPFPKFPTKEIEIKFVEEQIKLVENIMGAPPEVFNWGRVIYKPYETSAK